jgi:hypothetical protein
MTKGRVDLSKSTKMPKFTKDLPSHVRVLRGGPLRLDCAVSKSKHKVWGSHIVISYEITKPSKLLKYEAATCLFNCFLEAYKYDKN